jgi:drug/metabolite transporter (DMT)-like permease
MRSVQNNKTTHTLNWAILATLGFIWGGSFLGVEISLIGFGPITVAASRVTLAALILLVYAYVFGDGLPRISSSTDKRVWLHCLGMAIFTNALPFSLLSWGQQTVTSGFAGISMALVPLFVLPLSHKLVPGERLSQSRIIGFLFGFLGVVLLIGGEQIFVRQAFAPIMLLAQIACVTASCCYAIGSVITKLCPPVSTVSYASCGLTLASFMLMPTALWVEGIPQLPDKLAIAGIVYLALVPTAIATILLTTLVRRAGPPFLSLVNYQVPIWAVVIGVVVLGETLPGHFLVALSVILGGLFISELSTSRDSPSS